MSIQTQTSSFSGARAWRGRALALAATAALGLPAMAGCTSHQVNSGDSPAYLVIDSLQAASGADPGKFGATLASDVQTLIKTQDGSGPVGPTIFEDLGQVTLSLALKDPGSLAVAQRADAGQLHHGHALPRGVRARRRPQHRRRRRAVQLRRRDHRDGERSATRRCPFTLVRSPGRRPRRRCARWWARAPRARSRRSPTSRSMAPTRRAAPSV